MPLQQPAAAPSVEREGVVPLVRQQPTAPAEFAGFAPSRAPETATPPAQAAREPIADRAFVGTLAAIGAILASRLILLLAFIGAFVLAMKADGTPGWWVLVAYTCLTVLPLTVLDVITRQRGGL